MISQEIPRTSVIAAIHFCQTRNFTMNEQISQLQDMVPAGSLEGLDPIPLKYSFLYFIQDYIIAGDKANCEDIFIGACLKADNLLARNPHIWTKEFNLEADAAEEAGKQKRVRRIFLRKKKKGKRLQKKNTG